MKISLNMTILFALAVLVVVNIALFVQGITLSDEIHTFEQETGNLQKENSEITQELFRLSSYTMTASLAAELEYGKFNKPIYTEVPQYARN